MENGVVTVNDDRIVKVELSDGSYVECIKAEHNYDLFPVGEVVIVSSTHIIKHATTGHTYLPIDWKSKRLDKLHPHLCACGDCMASGKQFS